MLAFNAIRHHKRLILFTGLLLTVGAVVLMGGCALAGPMLSPTGFEARIPAQYDISRHKEETVYVAVHATHGSRTDLDLPGLVSTAVAGRLQKNAGLKPEQIIEDVSFAGSAGALGLTVEERARAAGADLLLYVEIEDYNLFNVHSKGYYTGHLVTRSMLEDLETDETLWPKEPAGRRVESSVELETAGREAALGRLTAATAHCIVRELAATPKSGYRCADEHQTVEDLMKDLE